MNGAIAKWYAANAIQRMDQFKSWAQRVAQLAPGPDILEVAPGPGYFSIELAKRGTFRITGLDISETFVQIAREKALEANVPVDFRQGNASQMPFPEDRFDFVFCSAAFKNFTDPVGALREMWRVLRPGGNALIIDLRKDAEPASIGREVESMRLSRVNRVLTKLIFRFVLLKRAYTRTQIEQLVSNTKFRSIEIAERPLALDILLTK
jgi:ubiquinone/menaquinone biosynthesis C-methylase UbiE